MSLYLINENGYTLKKARSRQYPIETMMDVDFADDIALFANTPTYTKSLVHSLEQAAGDIGLYENANKTEYVHFNREGVTFNLNGDPLKFYIHRQQRLIF